MPADQKHGGIVRYNVVYKLSKTGAEVIETVDSHIRNVELTNLKKYMAYRIQVLAATVKGDGPRSVPIAVSTDQDSK